MHGEEAERSQNPFHAQKVALHQSRLLQLAEEKMVAPQTVEVDLTDGACNQACGHCSFSSGEGGELQQIDADALHGALTEMYELGTRAVEFVGGGEPTTHRRVADIISATKNIGAGDMHIGIITNGVLAERLLPVADALDYVRVSLDAGDADLYAQLHGAPAWQFNKVLRNVERLREAIPRSRTMGLGLAYLVVPPKNHQEQPVVQATQLAVETGVNYIVYRPAQLRVPVNPDLWKVAQQSIFTARRWLRQQPLEARELAVFSSSDARWQTLQPGQHPVGRCDGKPLVAIVQANGDIAHCNLYRNRRELKIGNILDPAGFTAQWMGADHRQSWLDTEISGCPNPCKINDYTAAVRDVREGKPLEPPLLSEVAHPGFV